MEAHNSAAAASQAHEFHIQRIMVQRERDSWENHSVFRMHADDVTERPDIVT